MLSTIIAAIHVQYVQYTVEFVLTVSIYNILNRGIIRQTGEGGGVLLRSVAAKENIL
jgi:hypothetical protein